MNVISHQPKVGHSTLEPTDVALRKAGEQGKNVISSSSCEIHTLILDGIPTKLKFGDRNGASEPTGSVRGVDV